MMAARFRTLVALTFAAALVGCAEAPTAPLAEEAPVMDVQATSTLDVSMSCEPAGACEAYASGGTGTGYSFTWENADEVADGSGFSMAYPRCYTTGWISVSTTVTDSSGAQASASDWYYCGSMY